LDREYTERLLEQLDDAQEILANMLTSKYIGPLQSEVASWSEKLKVIIDVLELWLEVQYLWIYIESVFSNSSTVKEMPAEAKRFARVDKSWIRSQKQSFDMKSVLQCCLGSSVQENTKRVLLKDIQKELEICFKSLNAYLERKRKNFARYNFLSNTALLTILSHLLNADNFSMIRTHFGALFASIYDMKIVETREKEELERRSITSSATITMESRRRSTLIQSSDASMFTRQTTGKDQTHVDLDLEIAELHSADGETLTLLKRVPVEKGAEVWIPKLKESIADTIKRNVSMCLADIIGNCAVEELVIKYPAQICLIGLSFIWTKEVEQSIVELRNERKAISLGSKRFAQIISKFMSVLSKSRWTSIDSSVLTVHKLRLESMISVSYF
jgi:dynein heavy chain